MVGLYQFFQLGDDYLFAGILYQGLLGQFVEHPGDIQTCCEEFFGQCGHIDGELLSAGWLEGAFCYEFDKSLGQISWFATPYMFCSRLNHSAQHVEVVQAEGGVEEQDFTNGCLVDFKILYFGL